MALSRRAVLVLLLLISLVAFALRVLGLERQSLWRDEVDVLLFATRPIEQLLATFGKSGENGPLYFLAMRPWLAVAGHTEFALRFPASALGTLTVPLSFVLAVRLAGRQAALVTALLAATAPYLLWYGQDAKMYAAVTALVLAALYLTVRAAGSRTRWPWVALYAATSLCFYTHVLAALVVPVQALWLLLLPRAAPETPGEGAASPAAARRRFGRPAIVLLYLAALILPYLPMIWWQARLWLSPDFTTGHPFVRLDTMVQALAGAFTHGIRPVEHAVTLLPMILAAVAGVALWRTPPGTVERSRILLLIWICLPVLALYGLSLGMPIFTDRYLIWIIPALLCLVAMGVVALGRGWRAAGAALLGLIVALNLAALAGQTAPIKSDFRSAAAFVAARRQPGDLLLFQMPYIRYTFTYYLNGRRAPAVTPPWLDGPFTNAGQSEADAASQIASGVVGAPAVWLVASESDLWDRRGLAQQWLEHHGAATDQAAFPLVTVTRYRLDRD
jgi:uncharacterized membrane protein